MHQKLGPQSLVLDLTVNKQKTSNSISTQTELPPNFQSSSEEKSIPSPSSSIYTQTSSCESDTESKLLECLVCSEKFTAEDLVLHAVVDHELVMKLKKLKDPDDNDYFVKFLKSMVVGSDYLEERKKYYPEHWDHVDERIKIRIIAQIKFMSWSKMIERNMNQGIVRKVSTKFSKDV